MLISPTSIKQPKGTLTKVRVKAINYLTSFPIMIFFKAISSTSSPNLKEI